MKVVVGLRPSLPLPAAHLRRRTNVRHPSRAHLPERPAPGHGLDRPRDRRRRARPPVPLRRAVLARHPRPVHHLVAAPAGRRPRRRARRLQPAPQRHRPRSRSRRQRRPPLAVHALPRPVLPVRPGPVLRQQRPRGPTPPPPPPPPPGGSPPPPPPGPP